MCGICCILNLCQKEVTLDKASTRLHQRGPDKSSTSCVELPGATRLTLCGHVLHLRGDKAVSQPTQDQHGNCLLWNGEIFNGIQVADDESDTQILLSYLSRSNTVDHILSVMSKIQGPWAFIYWQSSSGTLWFGRDVFGRRSLLWHLPESNTDQLVLSSVLVKPYSFTEIPSVGIYKLVCNQAPEFDSKNMSLEISLFPWQHAVWPGSLDPVCGDTFQSRITEGMQCPNVALHLYEEKPVPSQMPRLNKQIPDTESTNMPALQDESKSLEYLQALLQSNSYLANLAQQLSQVLLEAVRTRVFNQQRKKSQQPQKHLAPTCTDSHSNHQHTLSSQDTDSQSQQKLNASRGARKQRSKLFYSDLPGQQQFTESAGTEPLAQQLATCSMGSDTLYTTADINADSPVQEQSQVNIDTDLPGNQQCTTGLCTTDLGICRTILDSGCNSGSIDFHHHKNAACGSKPAELTNPDTSGACLNGESLNEASLFGDAGVCPSGDVVTDGYEGEATAGSSLSRSQPLLSSAHVAILFSGGIDSTVIAALADRCVPEDEPIDLINVAFQQRVKNNPGKKKKPQEENNSRRWDVPDRLTGYVALSELNPRRHWNFIEVNVTAEELHTARQEHISDLLYPLETVLDDSIGCAVWFAARGHGTLGNGSCRGQAIHSTAKVLLCGMGADEQLVGYSRHRAKFQAGGWAGLVAEIELELTRLSARNLGRDDRIITDHGKESRFPFLDEKVVQFLCSLPIQDKADLSLPRGVGEKLLLRLCALGLGLEKTSTLPKRAIQFGSRIAKMENSKENASDKCDRLTKANS